MKICFYNIDLNYIEYLKKYETEIRGFTRVPNVQYKSGNNKFFYGAVLNVNGIDYFVPVSSKTHNKQDDLPIKSKDKLKKEISTLRFAYMLPVPRTCLSMLDISKITNYTQHEIVRKELAYCRKSKDKIEEQAQITYDRIVGKINKNLVHSSCDFKILEEAYINYCKENGIELPKEQQRNKNKNNEKSILEKPKQTSEQTFYISRSTLNKNAQKIKQERTDNQSKRKHKAKNSSIGDD